MLDGAVVFIADLHLAELHLQSHNASTRGVHSLALQFLEQAKRASHLYILGDLFEYWIGDDAVCESSAPNISTIISALATLTRSGTGLSIMLGNRDFLLGKAFAEQTGATLVRDDQLVISLANPNDTVLMHGDTLCADDTEYQAFRNTVRDAAWQQDFLAKSVEQRIAIAEQLRDGSRHASTQKQTDIMDVNTKAVDELFSVHGCQQIIHGHTHRPKVHQHPAGKRFVVGDWHSDHAEIVCFDGSSITLERFQSSQSL